MKNTNKKASVKYTSKIMNNRDMCGIKTADIKTIDDNQMNNMLLDLFGTVL